MAEFKLGRIRFVWKDQWTTGTPYYKDDVVRYGGKTFICTVGHTADASFYTDLDFVPTKWNQMTDGQEWQGDWTAETFYKVNDLVKYGGTVYVANESHTSAATLALGLEADLSKWDVFAEGFDWKDSWATATRYKINDLVKYGGITYICNTGHTSAATAADGLENHQANWDIFNSGIEYKGDWTGASVRYKVNDVVKQGSGLYICITAHTSTAVFADDSTVNWLEFTSGTGFEGDWQELSIYKPGDIVRYGGNQYISKTNHTGINPLTDTNTWDLFASGFRFQADWNIGTSYKIGEVVQLNGYVYLATADSPAYVRLVTATSATTNRFTCASTTGYIVGQAVKFTGSVFGGVAADATYYIKSIFSGAEFTISAFPDGAEFTPTTVSNPSGMTASVAALPTNTGYWAKLHSGIRWQGTWADDSEYVEGDIVRFNANAYICVLAHRSEGDDGSSVRTEGGGADNSRPDQDTNGIYWNIFTVGTETSVLTTRGDLVYFGGAGPTRLPVGIEGQVLSVSENSEPEWVTLGKVDYVYYVANHGTDAPAPVHGLTVDKPWASIRYAAEQVEQGPRNPNAKRLLELNRAFIQREVTEWVDYQVTNNIAPFTTAFTYADDRCERDTGLIVDALIYDLGHGGNVKAREAALAYVNGSQVGSYTLLSGQDSEDVAAFEYMLTVVEAVLDQTAPAANYQTLNGDNSTATVDQYFELAIAAEAEVMPTITSLVGIITDAIAAGVDTDIPERFEPNTLIELKTGRYREILPIIVPAGCCILGDEVRSVNAGPKAGTTSIFDAQYSIGALGRLETVISGVVAGTTVSKTTGNAETQVKEWPYADVEEQTSITSLVRGMQHNIDFRLGTSSMVSYTDPTNYNTSYLVGYGDARKLLKENKAYLQAEVIGFLDDSGSAVITAGSFIVGRFYNIETVGDTDFTLIGASANTVGVSFIATGVGAGTGTAVSQVYYSRTAYKHNIGYIVDALIYDLTYGGWNMSVNAGLAYFDGPGGVLMLDSEEKTALVAAYEFLKDLVNDVILRSSTVDRYQTDVVEYDDVAGSAGAATAAGEMFDFIIDIVNNGTTAAPTRVVTSITGTNTLNTAAAHGMLVGDTWTPTSTANGITSGTTYYVKNIPTTTSFTVSTAYDGTAVSGLTDGTGLTITGYWVNTPATAWAAALGTGLVTAFTTLSTASGTIVSNMTSFLTATYPALVYNSAKCERDVKIILDAVGYDFMFNSNSQSMKAAYAYLRASASDVFDLGQKIATRAALAYVKTQAKANVGGNATVQARIETLMTLIDDVIFTGSVEGTNTASPARNAHYATRLIELNRSFIAAEIDAWIANTYKGTASLTAVGTNYITVDSTSWLQRGVAIRFTGSTFGEIVADQTYYVNKIVSSTEITVSETLFGIDKGLTTNSGSMAFALFYDSVQCQRDVSRYLDAIKYDTKYPGNYKSMLATRYYANSVVGSQEEDMYYLRNGTGIRNSTLEGLSGDMTSFNEYGTRRVTAGAYVSLDPGWGPNDERTWITTRSPYVQNNATFGYAAIGQKIDGALHNGGNRSITSNDFTQLISDGIGAWITNNGRAELVSVFTYYSHIGYLAENGGRIRGTNGNNSYGDFGSVAEGFDSTETPNSGIVDNRFQFEATVGEVYTDNANEVLAFEFENAGSEYTRANWTINGAGSNATAVADEFRDDAVFQVRLTKEAEAGFDGEFGGSGYVTSANTAQGGTTTSITIAATDQEISTAYIGMKIYLTGGAGVGQFGIISAYNAGTKLAAIVKETTGGSGWDHVVPGTTIIGPDASTTYRIEPRVAFTAPGFTATARTLSSSLTYIDTEYAETAATYTPTAATGGTGVGATFKVTRKGTAYDVELVSGGTGFTRLDILTIAGNTVGGAATTNDITITVTSLNAVSGAITKFDYTGFGQGGQFLALATGTRDLPYSTNGTSWTTTANALPSAATWTSLASGLLTVEETAGAFIVGRSYTITSLGTTNWNLIGASASYAIGETFVATGVGLGTGKATPNASAVVAVASGGTTNAYSNDGGATWAAGAALPASGTWSAITYGAGAFATVDAGTTNVALSTTGGRTWALGGVLPSSATWSSIAYGKGVWVAVASGGTAAAYSTNNGTTWIGASLPSSSDWSSVTYGNNRFVAVSSTSGTVAAYSLDGITWVAATLPATAIWTKVSYGQGVFFAVSQTTQAATSEDGIVWTSRTMSTAANGFSSITFGNPDRNGLFVGVQRSTAGTVAASVKTGATTRARAYVSQEKIFAIYITEPGSGYTSAPTMTITDPSNIFEAPFEIRTGKGALANPSFTNRGLGYVAASAEMLAGSGNGYGDFYQSGSYIAVRQLTSRPVAGSNVVFANMPDRTFKLVNVLTFLGTEDGSYTAFFQVSPGLEVDEAPEHGASFNTRIRYSQVRLTGHDFLDIGTGGFLETNYPNDPLQDPIQANETVEGNGGRVFFTSTDQDGNFRVGDLFTIEQSTGIATLNADAFNIAGLQELSLGNITLGGASASITEFSTDPFFTADSDSVVPTQRAIKAYISSQIGGGGASLNVNSVTAGFVFINTNQITTTTESAIKMKARFDFRGGVTGLPLAFNYFLNK